ncbi:MAG TPA: tetratricopeptide repeat protein [bacterium (Candidatus Stahlbacteria)]|nr:tetratricopeptide repeat protein [Candidatus Stahlbacteria bacterium]
MSVVVILVPIIIAIVVLLLVIPKKRRPVNPPYIDALNSLLAGETDDAIKALREAVKNDTENIDAYIRLGDLLRKRGEHEKALRIHQSLTVRPNLARHEERRIFISLALDYLASGRDTRGLSLLKEMVKNNPKDRETLNTLLSIFEEKNLYQDAVDFLKSGGKKVVDKKIQAVYHLKAGQEFLAKDSKSAEFHLSQAQKLAPDSPMVLDALADIDLKEGRIDEAIDKWKQMLNQNPDLLVIIKERLEHTFFEANRFGEIERLYEELLHRHQHNIPISLALIRIYQKKGDTESLKSLLDRLKEYQPGLLLPRLIEVRLNLETSDAAELLDKIIEGDEHLRFKCSICGLERLDFEWRCPSCGSWESYQLTSFS